MSESCGQARRILWPESGLRPLDDEAADARRHAQDCAGCRAFFEEMGGLRDAVRASLAGGDMPVELREAIYERLAEARVERPRRRWGRALAVAAVLAAVLVAAVLMFPSGSPVGSLASTLAAEHAKAMGGDRLASSDPAEVERWLAARVPFAVFVPEFTGARLDGARICLTESGRGAVVEYVVGDRRLSYFILPAPSGALPQPRELVQVAESGYRMVLWRDSGLVHGLVGALSDEQLARLAHECMEQAMRLARRAGLGLLTAS